VNCTYLTVWGFSAVHFVDTNDHLFYTQGVGQQSVFSGLAVAGDTSLKFSSSRSNDQHGTIGLGGSCNDIILTHFSQNTDLSVPL